MSNSTEELKNSNDVISRQAAIDAIYKLCDEAETDNPHIDAVENELENLPSAHCDNCPYPSQYVPQEDAVSRKAVLQMLTSIKYTHCGTDGQADVIDTAKIMVNVMPSVQPENADCIYCHEDSDGYVKPIEKNCHAFIHFGMNGWEISLSAKGWNGSAKIMYCPMCGRRLKNG